MKKFKIINNNNQYQHNNPWNHRGNRKSKMIKNYKFKIIAKRCVKVIIKNILYCLMIKSYLLIKWDKMGIINNNKINKIMMVNKLIKCKVFRAGKANIANQHYKVKCN
jgi:hypothetical protein